MTKFSKREILGGSLLALSASALGPVAPAAAPRTAPAISPGPFDATRASLETYRTPDWFRLDSIRLFSERVIPALS